MHCKHTVRQTQKTVGLVVLSAAGPSCSPWYSTHRDSLYRTGFSCILLYSSVNL